MFAVTKDYPTVNNSVTNPSLGYQRLPPPQWSKRCRQVLLKTTNRLGRRWKLRHHRPLSLTPVAVSTRCYCILSLFQLLNC
ncbi:hypothetical protein Hanom_Chr14g01299161 [Helianthus anomalus]